MNSEEVWLICFANPHFIGVVILSYEGNGKQIASAVCFFFFSSLSLNRQDNHDCATCCAERCLRSKLAVERSETVSHGSSPAGGATKKPNAVALGFFERCVPQAKRDVSCGSDVALRA